MATEAPVTPWTALAVRAFLLNAPRASQLIAGSPSRIGTRSPSNVARLHFVVQTPGAPGLDRPAHGVYRPLALVEARMAPDGTDTDPEVAVMEAAAVLAAVLSSARNAIYNNARWTAHRVGGPFALPVDDSRGVPVYRGGVQAEITLHARTP